jgi:dynein heavy chain, axonemal
LDDPPT